MNKGKFSFFLFLIFFLPSVIFVLQFKKNREMINIETLNNGIKVLVKKIPYNEIMAIEIFIGGGSSIESQNEAGLTNLTTLLLFKGTKDKDYLQIAEGFDSLGGIWGASVERDFSEVHLVIPRKYWKDGLKLLAEVLISPKFSQEEINKEKGFILQQIKNIEDNPFEFAYQAFNENIYGHHPYAKPTFGFSETVTKFNYSDVIKQYQKCFCGQNITIVVVGNIDIKEAFKSIKSNFVNLPKGERLCIKEQAFNSKEQRKIIKKPDLMQSMIFLGFKAPSVKSEDYPALKLASAIMGEGMSSRLFENIRDKKGIGYSLGSFYPTRLATSTFVYYLGVQPERINESEVTLWEEIRKLQFEEISQEEFKKAKNYLIGNFYLSQQRNQEQAYFSGWFETLGLGYDFGLRYLERVKNLEIPQIKEAAKKYFKKENFLLLILTPQSL